MSGLKECLMKLSVSDILTAQEDIMGNAVSGHLFLPVVDDNFLHGEFAENKNSNEKEAYMQERRTQGLMASDYDLLSEHKLFLSCS